MCMCAKEVSVKLCMSAQDITEGKKPVCSYWKLFKCVSVGSPGIKLESGEHGLVSLLFPEHWFPVGNRTSQ